jgi:hypothetical protein
VWQSNSRIPRKGWRAWLLVGCTNVQAGEINQHDASYLRRPCRHATLQIERDGCWDIPFPLLHSTGAVGLKGGWLGTWVWELRYPPWLNRGPGML